MKLHVGTLHDRFVNPLVLRVSGDHGYIDVTVSPEDVDAAARLWSGATVPYYRQGSVWRYITDQAIEHMIE